MQKGAEVKLGFYTDGLVRRKYIRDNVFLTEGCGGMEEERRKTGSSQLFFSERAVVVTSNGG